MMKISLLGFMATGKSTVGRLLAREMELDFYETDALIVEEEGRSIAQIFEVEGEAYFRQLERIILKRVVTGEDDFVVSTGGGIVLAGDNRKLLKQETLPVLLEASPETIYKRSKEDGGRPLLEVKKPRQRIEELLEERREFYHCFENRISTEGKSPAEIVEEIKGLKEKI